MEADGAMSKDDARRIIHGMDAAAWKASQPPASDEQLKRMEESVAKNRDHR
jgi:hypothetical protein